MNFGLHVPPVTLRLLFPSMPVNIGTFSMFLRIRPNGSGQLLAFSACLPECRSAKKISGSKWLRSAFVPNALLSLLPCMPLLSTVCYTIHQIHGTGALLLPLSYTVTAPDLSLGVTNSEVMTQKDIPEVLLCLGGSGLGVARVCHLPCSCRGDSHNYPCGNFSDTSS